MTNSEKSGGRPRSQRRARRRPRRRRGAPSRPQKGETTSKTSADTQTEKSSPKEVFIYTYTIRKSG